MLKYLKVSLNLLLFFVIIYSYSEDLDSVSSNYAGDFWYINTGARSDAMGGTGAASCNTAFSHFYNPALLSHLYSKEISIEYTPIHGMEDDLGSGSAVLTLPSKLGVALAYTIFQSKNIKGFEELVGTQEERWQDITLRPDNKADFIFDYSYQAYRVSLAKWYDMDLSKGFAFSNSLPIRLSIGGSFKVLRQGLKYDIQTAKNIDYSSVTTDFDLGASARIIVDQLADLSREQQVFKVGLVFHLVLYFVVLISLVLLWNVANSTGTIENLENFMESFGWETFSFDGGALFKNLSIFGLFMVILFTGLWVLIATIFNLITDLVGGIRVTVLEEEVRASNDPVVEAGATQQ